MPGEANPLGDRLASIFDSVADGVTVMDRGGRIRFANDTAAQLLGRTRGSEVVGMSGAELVAEWELLGDDGGPLDPNLTPTRRALAGEQDPEQVVQFRRRGGGDTHWSLVRARLLPGDGPDGDLVVSAFQDITSLKRSEERLRLLAEASAILGESTDYQATLQRVANLAVPRLADWCVVDVLEWTHGITRVALAHADEQRLATAREVWQRWPADAGRPGAVREMLDRRRPVVIREVTDAILADAAQDPEHLEALRGLDMGAVLIAPLEARGEVLGALTLVNAPARRPFEGADIELAAELGRRAGAAIDAARLVWETQENARLRDEFIAVASHDMRTPLAAIRGYAQLAQRHLDREGQPDRDTLRRWLGDIDASVDRLAQLVAELLDATLVRAEGAVPLQLSRLALGSVVQDVVEHHRSLADGDRFVLEVADPEPIGVWDASRLARVLDNIVGNAVKFSPDGGEVVIRVAGDGERATVSVTDRGIGIAPSDRELIFNPMYRGNNAGGVAGTGLGLAGSRRLVELMGGTIHVESRLGEGSTFTVRLPIVPPEAAEAAGV
jgi:PAS domain S-box-containing protein